MRARTGQPEPRHTRPAGPRAPRARRRRRERASPINETSSPDQRQRDDATTTAPTPARAARRNACGIAVPSVSLPTTSEGRRRPAADH